MRSAAQKATSAGGETDVTRWDRVPAELRAIARWFPWKLVPNGDGTFKKVPLDRNGSWSDGGDPATWSSFEDAITRAPAEGGVGFAFRPEEDGIGGADLDGCRDPATGELADWARELVETFASYAEVSPSGTGVKIFAKGVPWSVLDGRKKVGATLPGPAMGSKRPGLELFAGWWFTVTGDHVPGTPTELRLAPLGWARLKESIDAAARDSRAVGAVRPTAGRNDALYRYGCGMRAKDWSPEAIAAAMRKENENRDSKLNDGFADGPLPESELVGVIAQVMRRPPGSAIAARELPLTDVGNGARLVAYHGDDLLYCYKWKAFLVWDGTRFRRDDGGEAVKRAKDTTRGILEEAAAIVEPERAKTAARWAFESQKRGRLEAMLWAAQSELAVTPDELDADPTLLNLASGTLDLATVTVREHRREDRITKLSPVAHDGDAECPLWSAFLDRIFAKDAELIAFIQRAVGYTLTGSVAEHVFFILYGTGANGKTVFLKTLAALLGDYATPVRTSALLAVDRNAGSAPNEDVADLAGVRFAYALEPEASLRLNEALIKAITGGDRIKARKLHQQLFEFEPSHKLWLAANHRPRIQAVDEGLWRRVLLVPFEVTIPEKERDRELEAKLRAELPGILVWAMKGLADYRERGLDPPEKVRAATSDYRNESDALGRFFDARLVLDPGASVSVRDMRAAYVAFVSEPEAFGARTFNHMLEERGLRQVLAGPTHNRERVWQGVRLREPRTGDDAQGELGESADDVPF